MRRLWILATLLVAAGLVIGLGARGGPARPAAAGHDGVALEAADAAAHVEEADQVTPGTFNGSFSASSCGANTFAVPAGTATIDVAVTATLPTNDIALTLLAPGGASVGSSDLATSPEAIHYAPATLAPGTYTVKVCPSSNPATPFVPPLTYTGTFTTTDLPLGGTSVNGSGGSVAVGPTTAGTPTPTRVAGTVRFSPETVVDPQRTEGEPVNFFAPDGSYWESGPFGTSSQQSWVHRSTDGGLEFHTVGTAGLRPDAPPGGGDTDIVVDDQGFAYFSDLEGLTNVGTSVSNDGGNTWRKQTLAAQEAGVDRQWFALDDGTTAAASDNTVFLTYRQIPLGPQILSSPGSTGAGDPVGGLVWTNSAAAGSQLTVSSGAPCGKLIFDPVKRNLYLPCGQSGANSTDHVELVIGHVAPGQRTGIAYRTVELPPSPGKGGVNTVFPWIAADRAGNLMAVWVDRNDRQVYETTSTDEGKTWTSPIQVNSGPARTNTFPEVAGGAAGTFVVAWYGSDSSQDSDHQPANTAADSGKFPWYGYVATITGADTLKPTIAQQPFTEHPMHYGLVCNSGTTCTSGRTMADYFDVGLDRTGAIRLVFDDESSQYRQAHLMEVRQLAGAAPANPMADPTGDAQMPHYAVTGTGPSLPRYDFTRLALSQPSDGVLRVQMSVASLASHAPPPGKTTGVWLTRFQALSTMPNGAQAYRIFYVGAKSVNGGALTYFAGSGDDPTGCIETSSGCKILTYPAEQALTSGTVSGGTITIDVALQGGFGANRPLLGSTLYSVTALSYGENADSDVYEEGDATHSFDYALGGVPPKAAPPGVPHVGSGGGGAGGGSGAGGASGTGGAGAGGVAGASASKRRFLRAHGASFSIDLRRGSDKVRFRARGISFHSLRLRGIVFAAHAARLRGSALVNGRRVAFTAVAVDRGTRRNGDLFRLAWAHRAAVTLRGDVVIR